MNRPRLIVLIAMIAWSSLAGPANAERSVLWPVPGRPALVQAGGNLDLGLREEGASCRLAGPGQTFELELALSSPVAGVRPGTAKLPVSLPPGVYDLVVEYEHGAEVQPGVVHVLTEFPAAFSIAIVRAAALTEGSPDPAGLADSLERLLEPTAVALTFLMGPLSTQHRAGVPAGIREALARLRLPVYVCLAEADLAQPDVAATFGPSSYPLRIGEDGFLVLGPGLSAADPGVPGAIGDAYLARRTLRPCRWTTGVTARFGLDWDLQGQIVVFVDDPLDFLVAGAVPAALSDTVPWGKTRLVPSPAIPRGTLLILDVDAGGVRLRQRAE